jgi:hypothetical protein
LENRLIEIVSELCQVNSGDLAFAGNGGQPARRAIGVDPNNASRYE